MSYGSGTATTGVLSSSTNNNQTGQTTNLPVINPADNFDQRVQDYFVNYFNDEIQMTDQEYEAAKTFFVARTRKTSLASLGSKA